MRSVPLIVTLLFSLGSAFAAEEEHIHAAGRSAAALKLNNEGTDYDAKGDFVNARRCFDKAIRIDSTMWPVYFNRAVIDMKEHKLKQGVDDCTMALGGNSSFNEAAALRALLYSKMGQYAVARSELDRLIALGGRGNAYDHALNASAWLLATCPDSRFRNGQLAITQANRAVNLTSVHKSACLDTLAAAYAETGDFNAAIRTEEKALSLTKSPQEMKENQKHLTAFKEHRPWRENSM